MVTNTLSELCLHGPYHHRGNRDCTPFSKHEQDDLSSACHRKISFTPFRNEESPNVRIHHYDHYSPNHRHIHTHPSHTTPHWLTTPIMYPVFPLHTCTVSLSQATPSLRTTHTLKEARTSETNKNL